MIEAINLMKEYKGHKALKDVSFSIDEGEIFCLIGANGAGKSTTIKIFTGQFAASAGKAMINNINVNTDFKKVKKDIAYVPENLMLYGHLSGLENLDFFCRISGLHYSKDRLKIYLDKAGLEEVYFDRKLENYSKGMRQKVGIAFALAKQAKVLFLDEPTSGLDPKSIIEFSSLIRDLKKQSMTILMTSHDLFRTINDADKIGIMKNGALLDVLPANQLTHTQLEDKYLNYMEA